MTIVNSTTKVCNRCNTEKPLTEYYLWSSNKKPMPCCKKCHQARHKSYTPVPADRCGVDHQNEFITILRQRGIYASPGKSSEYLHTDVVVWGCVRIEVKYGEARGQANPNKWVFRFTERQATGMLMADLIAFMCPDEHGHTCYLIDPACPELYRDGKFKPVMSINLGTHRKNRQDGKRPLSEELLSTHRDNWQLIEQKRLEVATMFQQKALAG